MILIHLYKLFRLLIHPDFIRKNFYDCGHVPGRISHTGVPPVTGGICLSPDL